MNFYVLKGERTAENASSLTDVVQADKSNIGEAPQCEACGRYVGMCKWLPPFCVELDTWGETYGDVAFQGGCEWFLVSEPFRHMFMNEGLTGLTGFHSVEVVKTRRHNRKLQGGPPKYFKVDVVRSLTSVDPVASGFEWSDSDPNCPVCLFPKRGVLIRFKQLVIRSDTWQKQDIFVPRGGSEIVVVSRFKDLCEKWGIKNALFTAALDYSVDYHPQRRGLADEALVQSVGPNNVEPKGGG